MPVKAYIAMTAVMILLLLCPLAVAKAPPDIPEQEYTIWGQVRLSDPNLPYNAIITGKDNGYNISLKINDAITASYTMGSNAKNGDYYVLKIPLGKSKAVKTGDQIFIYINDLPINKAYLDSQNDPIDLPTLVGNSSETRRIDLVLLVDKTPPYIINQNPQPNASAKRNSAIHLEIKDDGDGVDQNSISMKVEGISVKPLIKPVVNGYALIYQPDESFTNNQQVDVNIYATDLSSFKNEISLSYYFTIINSLPVASNLLIMPQKPMTGDALICSYDFTDDDGDDENGSEIKWYKDDKYQQYYKNDLRVSPTSTAKGQVWHFTVKPRDSNDFGEIFISDKIIIQNTPPVSKNVKVTPSNPTSTTGISCDYDYDDADDDAEQKADIKWYMNDEQQTGFDDLLSISPNEIIKGQKWHYTIRPYDGTDYGETQKSEAITIGNSAPVASNVRIEPSDPLSGEKLICKYDYYDADSDKETGTTIRWYKNGNIQSKYNDMKVLPEGLTSVGDSWDYIVRVGDGTEQGKYQRSEAVIIGNGLPVADDPKIEISPEGDLVAKYTYKDREPEDGTEIRWYKARQVQTRHINQTRIPSSDTNKGEVWYFTVRPCDGVDYGEIKTSPSLTIGNVPPSASELTLTPKYPITTDALLCDYRYIDADGDMENGTEIKWYKNGEYQQQYENLHSIPSSEAKKGDIWYFTITPRDGTDFGELKTSSKITIGNILPTASDLVIKPDNPITTDELTCEYIYSDIDGDQEEDTEVKWYRNGIYQSSYKNKLTVSPSSTKKGQVWYFTVKPNDGTIFGEIYKSESITIGNALPTASNLSIIPSKPLPGDNLVCKYEYGDIDDDAEDGTIIEWYRDGIPQKQLKNHIQIMASETKKGEVWYFTVKAFDSIDYGEVKASDSITIGNTPPKALNIRIAPSKPLAGDELTCVYDYFDEDGDAEGNTEIRWYKNGDVQSVYNNARSIPLDITSNNDMWYIVIITSDGTEQGKPQQSDSVIIGNSLPIASNLIIELSPQGDLLAKYDYKDIEPERDAEIRWYRDNSLYEQYNDQKIIRASEVKKGEIWHFTVRPSDGINFGEMQTSPPLTIGNILPEVFDLAIEPFEPMTTDHLTCSYTYFDDDGDPEGDSEIKWYKDGKLLEKYNDQKEIPPLETSKGEEWFFTMRPFDGTDYGEIKTSPITTIINSPPIASSPRIDPSDPLTGEKLICLYDYYDADSDAEIGTTIRWYKNGNTQSSYNDTKTIPEGITLIGDSWHFVVRVADGTEQGKYQKSESVIIGNGLPIANNLVIEMTLDGNLIARYTYKDREPEDGTEIKWYRDGNHQEKYDNQKTISSSETKKGEKWHFTVQPRDGRDFGDIQTSGKITIGNTPPFADNPVLSPSSPLTTDILICSYNYSDEDRDTENGTEIKWYKNGKHQEKYDGHKEILPPETNKGDEWYFTIKPCDGTDFGKIKASAKIIIGNTLPTADNLIISPDDPLTTDELTCSYSYSDIDNDPEEGTEIRWYRDDVYQQYYKNKTRVSATSTSKGQTWYFTIKPKDGDDSGETKTSASIKIGNTLPTAQNLKILPSKPLTTNDLTCSYSYKDIDNDLENGTEIKWYKNGSLQENYNNRTLILAKDIKKGEQWEFEVIPKDGTDFGAIIRSSPVPIGNTPPILQMLSIVPLKPTIDDDLECKYEFSDMDNDIESGTQIRWYMNGKLQSQFNDSIIIPSSVTKADQIWHVIIKVSDGIDFSEPKQSASVTILDKIPVVIPNIPPKVINTKILPEFPLTTDSLIASYNYIDADGDQEKGSEIKWYRDGKQQQTFNDKIIIPSNETNKGQTWYFTITPKDGKVFGGTYISASVIIGNIPPNVSGIYITPEFPKVTDNLSCNYVYNDTDNDPEENTEIKWYKDGILQELFSNQRIIPPNELRKGQNWYFTIKPKDDMDFGEMKSSQVVIVSNSAPVASNPEISPSLPLTDDDLTCKYNFTDADSDTGNGTEINWYKDGKLQALYNNMASIPASETSKGQKWHFTVRPRDGNIFGDVISSEAIFIGDTPPALSDVSIFPSNPLKTDDLSCHYTCFDIDNETEMNIDIRWFRNDKYRAEYDNKQVIPSNAISKGEKWHFSIRVNNADYTSQWQESDTVMIRNTIPEAIIRADRYITTVGTPIRLFGSDSKDNDGDKLSYRWDFDLTDGIMTESTEADPVFSYDKIGEYVISLIVNDEASDSNIARITIKVEDSLKLLSASYDIPDTLLTLRFNRQIQPLPPRDDISILFSDNRAILIKNDGVIITQPEPSSLALDISSQPDVAIEIVKSAVIEKQKANLAIKEGTFTDIQGLGNKASADNVVLTLASDGFSVGLLGDANGNGVVNSYDAELVLQSVAKGAEILPIYDSATKISRWMAKYEYPYDAVLDIADIDRDGQITSFDSSLIMREYYELIPGEIQPEIIPAQFRKAIAGIRQQTKREFAFDIALNDNSQVYSADAILTYEPQFLSPKRISQGTATSSWLLAYVIPEPGKIKIYMAGARQPEKEGLLLEVYFDSVTDDAISKPSIISIQINAGKTRAILENLPISSALLQNYPNPCNPGTWLPYKLTSQTDVTITIYDAGGKVVRRLDLGTKTPGNYVDESRAAFWDGKNEQGEEATSGIYFYNIRAGEFTATKKMIIQR